MLNDIKLALRMLVKSPGFTLVSVITLAVGIGSVTVAFAAVNAVLLKPLPYVQHQERMLQFTEENAAHGATDMGIAYPDFADLKERMTTLEGIWVHLDRTMILSGTDEPERLLGTELSWDGFKLMGVQPVLGRNFTAEDAKLGSPAVALIGYGLWQSRFGGDPHITDIPVTLNGQSVQIIGVMPKGWGYSETSTVWTVFRPTAEIAVARANYYLEGHAMMKPGVSLRQVQAEADAVMRALAQEHTTTNANVGARFRHVREEATADVSHQLYLLLGAVSFVFFIACLNVANLILARSVTRTKEVAIRLALGAGRRRLVVQFIVESLVLATLGGVGGLVFGSWGLDAMWHGLNTEVPFWLQTGLDGRVFGVVLGLVVIASLIFGLVPAIQATRPNVIRELKESGRGSGDGGLRGNKLRQLLVVTEVALALVLLVGAGLMMRSFLKLGDVDLGFNARDTLTFRVGLPVTIATNDDISRQFFGNLQNRLIRMPGVEAAGASSLIPLNHSNNMRALVLEGQAEPKTISEAVIGQHRIVLGDYFGALKIPLLTGRLLDDRLDRTDTPKVAVVDEAFAQLHFGSSEAALGKRFRMLDPGADPLPPWLQIVGVVGNTRNSVTRPDPKPTYYLPFDQEPSNFMTVALRTQSDPTGFIPAARNEVLAVNKDIPIYNVYPLETLRQRSAWSQAFFSRLFTVAGIIALFLASIGVYGVMSYSVAQRTAEIGVRMALGAQPGTVVGMMLVRGLRLVGAGLAIGFAGSWFAAQLLSSSLYGISPHDPPTFALVPLLLATVALFACWLPSRRATRINPIDALRAE
jgi:putative ABC transport system permease protein